MTPRVYWLHVHYLGAPGGRELTVRVGGERGRYLTATRINFTGMDGSFVRRGNRQPRAVVKVRSIVRRQPGGVLEITRA